MKLFLTLWLLSQAFWSAAQQPEVQALLAREKVPGMQLIYTKGTTTKAYQLGQHKSGGQPVTNTTIFQAASLGKVVLAYVALRLHDRGVLALDQPLSTYYQYPRLGPQKGADRITARLVLTHTTGLPNWAENPLAASWKTSALRLKYAPDSCWNYSGEGFVYLQKTLEHLTGKSLSELAQTEVFGPLKMSHSSFTWRRSFARNAASGHDKAGQPTQVRRFAEPNAGFSLLTTAADYHRFLQVLISGQGLKPSTALLLQTPATEASRCGRPTSPTDPAIAWAYGLGLADTSHGPALWHWGDNDDFQGFFMAFPSTHESLLFFTNSGNGLKLTDDLLRLFIGPGQYKAMQWLAEE